MRPAIGNWLKNRVLRRLGCPVLGRGGACAERLRQAPICRLDELQVSLDPPGLRGVPDESMPSESEKVAAAKSAPAGFEEPVERPLHAIS